MIESLQSAEGLASQPNAVKNCAEPVANYQASTKDKQAKRLDLLIPT